MRNTQLFACFVNVLRIFYLFLKLFFNNFKERMLTPYLIKESRIPSPIQISITASVSHPNMPNHPILSAEQPRNYRQTSKNTRNHL